MQVHQLVQNSAEVLTITRLSPGDVYKRVAEPGYNSEPTLKYGVVQSVMNNGEDSAITALEYEADYSQGAKATVRIITGGKPVAIFPATPEEVTAHLEELHTSAMRAVTEAEDALVKRRAALEAVERLRATVGNLSAPATASHIIDAASTEGPGEVDDAEVF